MQAEQPDRLSDQEQRAAMLLAWGGYRTITDLHRAIEQHFPGLADRPTISRYLNYQPKRPSYFVLEGIAWAFGMSVPELKAILYDGEPFPRLGDSAKASYTSGLPMGELAMAQPA